MTAHDDLLARHRAVMPDWLTLYYDHPIALAHGDGRRVTAIGRVSVEELIDLIGRLQPADAAAWDDALQQQQDTGSPPAPVEIGGTPTGDWSAQVGNGWFWVSSLDEFANHSWDPTPG